MKKLIILSALLLSACSAVETGGRPAVEWCVDKIKEKIMFVENKVTAFGYSYQEMRFESTDAKWKLEYAFDKTYLVETVYENVYGTYDDKWFCGISFRESDASYVVKSYITDVQCVRISQIRL